jgi:uncharacterized protein (TIGR02246 family)
MRKTVSLLLLVLAGAVQAEPVPAAAVAELQLRALNHRHVSEGDRFAQAIAGDRFLSMSTAGEWSPRSQSPVLASASYDDVRVRLFGEVALVHGLIESIAPTGEISRVRYTDVYRWEGRAWQLVHVQRTMLKPTTDRAQRHGTAPAHAPYTGKDPTGDDLAVLTALNEQYVRAFRESDVAWYDAHLAPDYVVVYGDGSFHDRADALADFAKPTFRDHLKSFPVAKVEVRRFGDVALVSAENAFEAKDGRKGVNRYTDTWVRRDGRWQCVAAHITVNQPLR